MVNESQLVGVIKQAKENDKARKFTQSIEMIMVFRDVDEKKDLPLMKLFNCQEKPNLLQYA